MRNFLFLICCYSVILSCEDTKKTEQVSTEITTKTITKDAPIEKKKPIPTIEKITNENVVPFLTEYGNNNKETKVKIKTRLGDINIQLFNDTPLHRANFIYLVKQKYFNETFFHRVVPKFIIQGGNSDLPATNKKRFALGDDYLLPAEIKHPHVYGTISGAKEYRENPDKKSHPYEFFIFLGQPVSKRHLDGSYTVFGKVTSGMDIVEKIANIDADEGEWPIQNIYISAEIIE
ncbi:peptidyl-prolyl cis-trans isomerase, cyclophilin-type [unidentified eubacterium SCB49]|nr:peptidyl-prolyl cis-trans isomerase, cyclophilin-type [unidentified eubacterium SCB49]